VTDRLPDELHDEFSARREIGQVVGGSLLEGLTMKLNAGESVEDVRAGKFVVVDGEKHQFFSMITDVVLSTSASGIEHNPPGREDRLMHRVLSGTTTYGTIKLRPMLMLPTGSEGSDPEKDLRPVKTIPGHFSPVYTATAQDVSRVFGDERIDPRYFHIGAPLDMADIPVCLDLERFVERSNGIFGKSGTGKTFLTRIVLCGIIRNRKAVNLVFDMHSEYGWEGQYETREGQRTVPGLKRHFQDRVAVFSLDVESSKRRKSPVDHEIKIPYSQITIDDIILLQGELNLPPTAVETCYALVQKYGDSWITRFLSLSLSDMKDVSEEINVHPQSLSALQRRLNVLTQTCSGFLTERPDGGETDAVDAIMNYLGSGKHVVVEFGQHRRPLQYMLVANILTRRIHDLYVRETEKWMGGSGAKPAPLVITIEEAHKFLSPSLASQTIFGTIAREMRKYFVTLLVVDQRPSGIDREILSQVGTKITCLLNDDRDIDAVLEGVSNASGLKGVLASLDSKQQALVLGHAVPMPIVVETRDYNDPKFRESMVDRGGSTDKPDEVIEREIERDFA